jgi:hypothetical protein
MEADRDLPWRNLCCEHRRSKLHGNEQRSHRAFRLSGFYANSNVMSRLRCVLMITSLIQLYIIRFNTFKWLAMQQITLNLSDHPLLYNMNNLMNRNISQLIQTVCEHKICAVISRWSLCDFIEIAILLNHSAVFGQAKHFTDDRVSPIDACLGYSRWDAARISSWFEHIYSLPCISVMADLCYQSRDGTIVYIGHKL